MTTHVAPKRAVRLAAVLSLLILALGLPTAALGHAELDTSDPAEGATVEAPFAGPITMTFTEDLAKESFADLLDGSGKLPATSAVDGDTMTLTPDTALVEGDYRIEWTSVADDGHIERGKINFTVGPEPTPEPTAEPTPTPSGTATATPTAAATATPAASGAASASASASPSASAAGSPTAGPSISPLPSGTPDPGATSSGGDAILPIIAAVVIVGALAAILLRRRDSNASSSGS